MKQPDLQGDLAAKSLYSFDDSDKTKSKVATPTENINFFGPPSLIKGIEYPVTDEVEQMLKRAYNQGHKDALRINRAGRIVENDPFLDILRGRVKQIRKEKIQRGEIEPVTKKERKWRLGL